MNDRIIEYLIANQEAIKEEMLKLIERKHLILQNGGDDVYGTISDQCDAKIKQSIAFTVAGELALPVENVIIILESIDIGEYISV